MTPSSTVDCAELHNQLGARLLRAAHRAGTNTFLSPVSIGMALHMLYLGSTGETRNEMARVLGLMDIDLEDTNRELLKRVSNVDGPTLRIASSIWYHRHQETLLADYVARLQLAFNSTVHDRDFAASETLNDINNWVSENTDGKIPEILSTLSPRSRAVLINAVYFKGDWRHPFEKEDTQEGSWLGLDGEQPVDLMQRWGNYSYLKTPSGDLVGLDYAPRGELVCWILLPPRDAPLEAVIEQLDSLPLSRWKRTATGCDVRLELPRFTMRNRYELKDSLRQLGLQRTFSADGDFGAMDSSGLFRVASMVHEAVLELQEEGTVAAAASAVHMLAGFAFQERPEPIHVRCDHPFLLMIDHRRTGAELFLGAVYDPEPL